MSDSAAAIFSCTIGDNEKAFSHFWEHTVGSCHATMALRADYQAQLARCHKELGFMHVRFHGLLCDDMGTLMNENDKLVYSFYNADKICDFLLATGMRPFMELSFMPTALASGDKIVFHYKGNVTPPKDYSAWATLIEKLVQHWADRYGIDEVKEWFFEVWNEPNLDAFWTGTQADYFKLYQHTAAAIKKVNSQLKVGGPATADNEWVPEFLDFCKNNNVPADFVSTHHYPTDAFGQPGDDTVTQLSKSERSVLRKEAAKVKSQARGLPLYYTEWASSSNPFDTMHDEPYAAAFIIKTVMEANGIVDGYSYWTFSDIFEENYFSSIPFHGGFGLMNIYGIPKPAYRAYELLHHMGDQLLQVTGSHTTVDVWITRNEKCIKVLITNWALPKHDIKAETVKITLNGISAIESAWEERIDNTSANATVAWKEMGSPDTLLPEQVATLEERSQLLKKEITADFRNNIVTFAVDMQPQATACITLILK